MNDTKDEIKKLEEEWDELTRRIEENFEKRRLLAQQLHEEYQALSLR